MSRGHRASGDLIPWSLSQQYQDGQFAGLSGARIVRIATHTDVQKVCFCGYVCVLFVYRDGRAKGVLLCFCSCVCVYCCTRTYTEEAGWGVPVKGSPA